MMHPEDSVLPIFGLVPAHFHQALFRTIARQRFHKIFGPLQARFAELGLPPAPGDPMSKRPTVAQDLISVMEAGHVRAAGAVRSVDGHNVTFADGATRHVDVIICATGYHIAFPFLDPSIADTAGDDLQLFCGAMSAVRNDLFFVGLGRPAGAFWPLAEAQSRLAAATFSGTYRPPERAEIKRRARPAMASLLFNPALYGRELRDELRRGGVRARRAR